VILKLGHRPNKAADIAVDARLETRISKVVDHRPKPTRCHIAVRPENVTEDESKVYNVAHHQANILFAKEMVGVN